MCTKVSLGKHKLNRSCNSSLFNDNGIKFSIMKVSANLHSVLIKTCGKRFTAHAHIFCGFRPVSIFRVTKLPHSQALRAVALLKGASAVPISWTGTFTVHTWLAVDPPVPKPRPYSPARLYTYHPLPPSTTWVPFIVLLMGTLTVLFKERESISSFRFFKVWYLNNKCHISSLRQNRQLFTVSSKWCTADRCTFQRTLQTHRFTDFFFQQGFIQQI